MARKKKDERQEEPTGLPESVEILGARRPVYAPSFAIRESLVEALGAEMAKSGGRQTVSYLRVCAAAVIGCLGQFGPQGLTWAQAGFDVLEYGDKAYSWLRSQGAAKDDIDRIGGGLVLGLSEVLLPRQAEVDEVTDFSEAGGDGQTSSASD